ncbi:MAG: hypothetical protein MUP80_15390, partial [Acidobacteriia bacterium]|nr:hypothetical protein [Terriglobia bacterium]
HLITGGQLSAMPHGPVNSFVCDFVRNRVPVAIWNRYVGIPMDPKFSDQDVADIMAAVRKVYPAVVKA